MITFKSNKTFVRPAFIAAALILPLSGAFAAGSDGSAQQQARELLSPAVQSVGLGTKLKNQAVTHVVRVDAQEQARELLFGRQTAGAHSTDAEQSGRRQVQADAQQRARRLLIGSEG